MVNEAAAAPRPEVIPGPVLTRLVMYKYSQSHSFLAAGLVGTAFLAYQPLTPDQELCASIGSAFILASGIASSIALVAFIFVWHISKFAPNKPEDKMRRIFAGACRSLGYGVLAFFFSAIFLVAGAAREGEMGGVAQRVLGEFILLAVYGYWHREQMGHNLEEYLNALPHDR